MKCSSNRMVAVENYEEDQTRFNSFSNSCVLKRIDVLLPKRVVARLIREATELLDGYGIDLTQYTPKLVLDKGIVGQVEWKNQNGKEIHVTGIYFDENTGEILQAGGHSGVLCY